MVFYAARCAGLILEWKRFSLPPRARAPWLQHATLRAEKEIPIFTSVGTGHPTLLHYYYTTASKVQSDQSVVDIYFNGFLTP